MRLDRGVSGKITCENGSCVIRVNRHEVRKHQRFTVAHEPSHFLLHSEIIDISLDGIRDNVLYHSGEPEQVEV